MCVIRTPLPPPCCPLPPQPHTPGAAPHHVAASRARASTQQQQHPAPRPQPCALLQLPVPVLLYMLEHFAPDDFSREGIPHGVLAALRREAGATVLRRGGPPPPLVVEGECTYYSPTDDMAMEKVEIGEEPGLEYDADSEDELNALGGLAADLGGPPPLRYKLLHNLWSAGVPRNRRITILRDDAADEGGTPMQMMPL